MPLPHQPNSVRYLKARLRILKRPMVWGSASALLLAILLFSEYWNHSDWFSGTEGDRTPTSGVASLDGLSNRTGLPSQEDSAIGIDIDSLPVLINDLGAASPTPNAQQPTQQESVNPNAANQASPTASPSPGASSTVAFQDQADAEQDSTSRNPFIPDARRVRLFDVNLPSLDQANTDSSGGAANAASGIAGVGLASGISALATPNQSIPTSSNSLGAAVQRRNEQTAAQSSSDQETPSQQQSPLLSGQIPTQLLPSGQTLQNPALPRTSPPAGTTGYITPPALTVIPSTPNNPYSASGTSQSLPGFPSAPQIAPPTLPNQSGVRPSTFPTSGYGANQGTSVNPYTNPYGASVPNPSPTPQPVYATPEPAPFTAPYSRGGGEINTFANP